MSWLDIPTTFVCVRLLECVLCGRRINISRRRVKSAARLPRIYNCVAWSLNSVLLYACSVFKYIANEFPRAMYWSHQNAIFSRMRNCGIPQPLLIRINFASKPSTYRQRIASFILQNVSWNDYIHISRIHGCGYAPVVRETRTYLSHSPRCKSIATF